MIGLSLLLVIATSAGGATRDAALQTEHGIVATVIDGDTIRLVDERRVRLLQIDAPEVGSGECYSRASARVLRAMLPAGASVRLEQDARLDDVDRYGRLLRYVWRGGLNTNLAMVARGAAAPWFYDGDRGAYAARLLGVAQAARKARTGLWFACPGTVLDPTRSLTTLQRRTAPPALRASVPPAPRSGCARSYVGVCIPSPPPDLDCGEIGHRRFTVRWDVPAPDPHGFDGDRDGVGCER